jgi:hypothetical protein
MSACWQAFWLAENLAFVLSRNPACVLTSIPSIMLTCHIASLLAGTEFPGEISS